MTEKEKELAKLIKEQARDMRNSHIIRPTKCGYKYGDIFEFPADNALLDTMTDKGLPEYNSYHGWHKDDV